MKPTFIVKMPRLGDRIMRTMTTPNIWKDITAEPCEVTYIDINKKWYQVTFVKSGVKECYKVPDIDEVKVFAKDYKKAFGKYPVGVYVYESGAIYSSVTDCAKAIGVLPCTVSKHIHGEISNIKGYHIYIL